MTVGLYLINPKYPHNVGGALRALSAYGGSYLYWSGDRVTLDSGGKGSRLPREERLRAYQEETVFRAYTGGLRELIQKGLTPVAVEVNDTFEPLPLFEHPENAVYVFGPEDGSLGRGTLTACHRFVTIPTRSCLNLAMAISTVLYDRSAKDGMREWGSEYAVAKRWQTEWMPDAMKRDWE